jgi:hypothetical protein
VRTDSDIAAYRGLSNGAQEVEISSRGRVFTVVRKHFYGASQDLSRIGQNLSVSTTKALPTTDSLEGKQTGSA